MNDYTPKIEEIVQEIREAVRGERDDETVLVPIGDLRVILESLTGLAEVERAAAERGYQRGWDDHLTEQRRADAGLIDAPVIVNPYRKEGRQ